MTIVWSLFAAAALAVTPVSGTAKTAQTVPTVYEAGHFYAVPETVDGQKLRLLVDTGGGGGGGMYWMTADVARRLHLKTRTCHHDLTVAALPDYKSGKALPPPPVDGTCGQALLVYDSPYQSADGQLGAGYFPGRVWTFDYPGHRLLLDGKAWHPDASAHATTLGFPRNAKGQATSGFARIVIHVDGKPIDMLLDTGATAHPTAAGEKATGIPTVNGYGVTSYIDHHVFEQWHKTHPHWRVVNNGDDIFGAGKATRLIEVPAVHIAGWSVGPVWFTERADKRFRGAHGMSQYMDKTVDGAVGANVFRHFVMTLDYPQATAYFRCARGCKPVPSSTP